MPNRPRPAVDAMVAEAAARKRAVARGDDPELCAEVIAAKQKMAMRAFLAKKVSGEKRYPTIPSYPYRGS